MKPAFDELKYEFGFAFYTLNNLPQSDINTWLAQELESDTIHHSSNPEWDIVAFAKQALWWSVRDHEDDPRALVAALSLQGIHPNITPDLLLWTAYRGRAEMVRHLVQAGADLEIRDEKENRSAEEWAHHGGHLEVEKYLRDQRITQERQALEQSLKDAGIEPIPPRRRISM